MENGIDEGVATEVDPAGSIEDEHSAANGELFAEEDDEQAPASQGEDQDDRFDPTSPEARHWQSVADRRVAKLETRLAEIEGSRAKERISGRGAGEAPGPPSVDELLAFSNFSMPDIPAGELEAAGFDDATLKALDRRIAAHAQQIARHAVSSITAYNQQVQTQQQKAATEQKLHGFIESLDPESAKAFLPLFDKYAPIAENDPDAFLDFAKKTLGIGEEPAQPKPRPVARQGLANTVRAASTRPTAPARTREQVYQPESIREGVAAVVARTMRKGGG